VDHESSGKVRIRSNVVLDPDSWFLVPGEIVENYRRGHFNSPGIKRPPRRQHDERMYYVPCGRCGRPIIEINMSGCNECTDAPTPERAQKNREQHEEILKRVAEERERLERPAAGNWRSSVPEREPVTGLGEGA
jgi:hypothetical protein